MKDAIAAILSHADTRDWKKISVPFGEESLDIAVPRRCVTLQMRHMPCLADSREDIARALNNPTGSPPLPAIISSTGKRPADITVCITVSDITRPVPYRGKRGILLPLLEIIESAGVRRDNIVFVIGNGMHRPSTSEERLAMYGSEVVDHYRIVDHDCEDRASQVLAAHTSRGTKVYVNRLFHQSDVKIVTGLVESHFMAGISGGRKAVCPALTNIETIRKFHGVDFLEDPRSTNLVLDGNPCHEEALEVAQTVGVDFMIGTTLDHALNITGVYAGDLVAAHREAFEAMKAFVEIPIDEPYDIVLTHGGYVGRDHYQSVKAAVSALPAVKDRGLIVMVSNTLDAEPIGSREYKTLLHLLTILGPDAYLSILRHPDWVFTKDQWEPEMWGKALRRVGTGGLIFCAPQISEEDSRILPGLNGHDFIDGKTAYGSHRETARAMLQNAVIYAAHHPRFGQRTPSMTFIAEGPYAIPLTQT